MKKINQSTPARWSKLASALTACSVLVSGSAFASQNMVFGLVGISLACVGIFIPFFVGENVK